MKLNTTHPYLTFSILFYFLFIWSCTNNNSDDHESKSSYDDLEENEESISEKSNILGEKYTEITGKKINDSQRNYAYEKLLNPDKLATLDDLVLRNEQIIEKMLEEGHSKQEINKVSKHFN